MPSPRTLVRAFGDPRSLRSAEAARRSLGALSAPWSCPRRTASRELHPEGAPPSSPPCARPLPGVRGQALVHPSASWNHPAGPVPPSWFHTTSTASSARSHLLASRPSCAWSRGLVASRSRPWGSLRFGSPVRPSVLPSRELPSCLPASALASCSTLAGRRPFPAALVTPSKAFPSSPAASRHPRSTCSRVASSACFPRFTVSRPFLSASLPVPPASCWHHKFR